MALWKEDYVVKNKFSRPALKLLTVEAIIMHWTGTAGAGDESHQKFFDGADGGASRYAGCHFFIDRDSATLIIPLNEVAYHANEKPSKVSRLLASTSYYKGGNANLNTIGIEMCLEKDGTIHPDTVKRSAQVVAELCKKYKLNPLNDIYRHHDITGKNCPAPWVKDSSKYTKFKKDVDALMKAKTVKPLPIVTKPPVTNKDKHTVVKGDTLWALASKYDTTVANLQKLNPDTKTGALEIGQVLKLKATETKPKTEEPKKTEPKKEAPKSTTGTHKVVAGDTLWSISQKYKTTIPALKSLNGFKGDALSVGQVVKVPKATEPKKETPKSTKLTYKRTLKKGLKGDDVKALQNALNSINFKCGTADGVYGDGTFDAVERFQKVFLPKEVDGIAGKNTIDKINSKTN